ncbi:hypothetical protein F5148DRAFT_1289806 [Russula earlei]|uniref:Uncharacterized protein n=1 Tax=Russula earlei TaxID=71964 RepID=A0ACC0TY84_9AGAM|nr:hypothetical protein F5148DRAFT_1289806 [Russula earlei]
MPTTRARVTINTNQAQSAPKAPEGGDVDTAKKRNISDVDSDSEIKTPTKRSRQPPQGKSTRQRRRQSASPITPPKGPRKRTNERPGLIGKKGRRTQQEIAAERAAKEVKTKAEAAARVEAVAGLVDLELEQEHEETMRRQCVLHRQPSVLDVTAYSSGEEFDWGLVDDVKDSEMEETDVGSDCGGSKPRADGQVATAKKTKKGQKPKRELLTQVAQQKNTMRLKKDGGGKRNIIPLPLASGLKGNWKNQAKLTQHQPILGGLTDDHASSVCPNFDQRKLGAVTEIVGVVSDNSKIDVQAIKKKAGQGGKVSRNEDTPAALLYPQHPVPAGRFKGTIIPKASSRTNIPRAETTVPPSALIIQIESAKKFSDLPSYLGNSKMIKQFRATCYHGWMASGDLFDGFSLESEHFLTIIRNSFSKTFPDTQYVPRLKDVFHRTVYDNIQTHRSNIARHAIEAVTAYISELSKVEIKEWVDQTRAARLGELIYAEPCPPGYSLVKGAANFKKPRGLLMTPFVANLAKPFLKYLEESLVEYGRPCGLIAIILVALERAVRAFETGEFQDPGPFNSNYKALLTEYLESVNMFNKWDDFYVACDFDQKPCGGSLAADMSQTDIGRRALNFSSSPIRA